MLDRLGLAQVGWAGVDGVDQAKSAIDLAERQWFGRDGKSTILPIGSHRLGTDVGKARRGK
jgi:hypothetical protein